MADSSTETMMPSKKKNNKSSKAFRILSLPRELRDRIYRNLLKPDRGNHVEQAYQLEPAVLRVNKQMHREASKVLYEENCWVIFTMNYRGLAQNIKASGYPMVTGDRFVSSSGAILFGGKPQLQIDLRVRRFYIQETQELMVVLLHHAQKICKVFTSDHTPEVEFIVCIRDTMEQREKRQKTMFECLKDIRGVGKTTIQGAKPSSTGTEIAKLMMTPIKHIDELLERAESYEKRGDKELALGRFIYAEEIYFDGFRYRVRISRKRWRDLILSLKMERVEARRQLFSWLFLVPCDFDAEAVSLSLKCAS